MIVHPSHRVMCCAKSKDSSVGRNDRIVKHRQHCGVLTWCESDGPEETAGLETSQLFTTT